MKRFTRTIETATARRATPPRDVQLAARSL